MLCGCRQWGGGCLGRSDESIVVRPLRNAFRSHSHRAEQRRKRRPLRLSLATAAAAALSLSLSVFVQPASSASVRVSGDDDGMSGADRGSSCVSVCGDWWSQPLKLYVRREQVDFVLSLRELIVRTHGLLLFCVVSTRFSHAVFSVVCDVDLLAVLCVMVSTRFSQSRTLSIVCVMAICLWVLVW